MKIDKLHIDGFGVFHDKNIQGFSKGINVLYGPNEAGKSTLLDFIRFTLFEYPRFQKDRRSPLMGGTHGGRIWLSNSTGEALSVYRHGNARGFKLEYKGEVSENQTLYQNLIGNASIDLYKNIYAITLDELTDVEQLSESGMEDRIFSMGMGLSGVDFGGFEKSLISHSEEYFKSRGFVQVLPKLVSEIATKEEAINKLRSKLGEYNLLSDQKEQLEEELNKLKELRTKLGQEKNDFSDLAKAYPDFVRYKEAEAKINKIGAIAIYPVQQLEKYEQLKRKTSSEENELIELNQKIEQLQEELSNLKWDESLSAQVGLLDFFKTNVKLYDEAKSKRNQEKEKLAKSNQLIESVLSRLGDGLNAQQLIGLEGTFELQSKATQVVEDQQKIDGKVGTKSEVVSRLKQEISELEMKKKKFVQALNEHSIQDEEQKGGAFKKKVALDTAFKSALEMSGRRPQNNIKLALILVLVFAVVGVGLLFLNLLSGAIVLGIALVGLFLVLVQRNNLPLEELNGKSANEINKELTALQEALTTYDQYIQQIDEVKHELQLKEDELTKTTLELEHFNTDSLNLQKEWKSLLEDLNLPTSILPARMNDFLSNVEELKRQHSNSMEAEAAIQNIEKLIADFEQKLEGIVPLGTALDTSFVYSLISKIEENEKVNSERKRHLEGLSLLSKQVEQKKDDLERLKRDLTALFQAVKVEDETSFYQVFERQEVLNKAKEEKENSANTIKTLCGAGQLESTLAKLSEYTPSELNVKRDETESEYEDVKNRYDELNKDLAATSTEIRHILELDDMYGFQNEKESLQTQLKEATKEWLATQLALEVLNQSKQKYEKERQPEVITQTRDFFRAITENAYEDLRISISEKHVGIIDAAGNSKTVQELSRGTREQLLLALRLGLIEEYEKNAEPLPVAFDDIMVNFDAERTSNLAEILTDFASERQVLYFTCHEHTKDLFESHGANIITW
ncbi:ATP-binding protein [Brumimicrobium sp.]|uniref:ATP-binding protein n=1 Tax=Brumimicrobium sp. TaxID=2029867 RepID=UPI003A92D6CE